VKKRSAKSVKKFTAKKPVQRAETSRASALKNSSPNSVATFAALRAILSEFDGKLRVTKDTPGNFEVVSLEPTYKGKPMYFGSVIIQKNYVSFHLFPLYACPELAGNLSPELQRHKQGKSCFNFTEPDLLLFVQLAALTTAGYRAFKNKGWV
jgi:hypothetical protein